MTDMKRLCISLDDELVRRLAELKKDVFYDRSYSALVREVLRAGLDVFDKKEA